MSDGVDEAVVLLIAANFADQEDGVENESGDDGAEEDDAEKDFDAFAPVEDDPAAADGEGDGSQNDAEAEEESNRLATAGDAHRKIVAGRGDGVRFEDSLASVSGRSLAHAEAWAPIHCISTGEGADPRGG